MTTAYILDAVRTPRGRGKAGKGALTGIHPQELLAQTHQANGQIDKAIADYRQVLELHPDDRWAREQIEALSGKR